MDITSAYNHLQHKQHGKKIPKQTKSLANICEEVLGFSLSKVWSLTPIFCLFNGEDEILFNSVSCYFMNPGCLVVAILICKIIRSVVSLKLTFFLGWN